MPPQTPLLWLALSLATPACRAEPPADDLGVVLVDTLPDHPRYRRPLHFGPAAAGAPLHVVAEQGGVIHAFELARDGSAGPPHVFLDLSDDVSRRGNEEGLLGVAFHPRFPSDPRVFVYYSVAGERRSRLSELDVPPGIPASADRSSERVLLEVDQPWRNHNGGGLLFGPDGMLYLGLGDGGAGSDRGDNGQDPATLLGSILRLDIDRCADGAPYGVPPDNPFVDRPGARGEIWALGLRNPWRLDFDPDTGLLWVGDVGQDAWEEIDVVERGGNYGWPLFEGLAPHRPEAEPGPGPLRDPVHVYPASLGRSVTGGVVYRGRDMPALFGHYLFADYLSGRVWAIDAARAGDPGGAPPAEFLRCGSVASFGRDAWGGVHLVSFDEGVRRLVSARRPSGGGDAAVEESAPPRDPARPRK